MSAIEEQWEMLGTKARLGTAFDKVASRFEIMTSRVAFIYSIDTHGLVWSATLHDPKMPKNILVGTGLPIVDGRLGGFDSFFDVAARYTNLVRSVPWFSAYLAHSSVKAEIRITGTGSLSGESTSSLLKDLQDNSFSQTAALQNVLSDCAFVQVSESGAWSRWLVLPDRRMLLWEFSGDKVLGWPARSLQSSPHYNWRNSAILVSENGAIIP